MKIGEIFWTPDRIAHIARHDILPEEVEEAAFDDIHASIQVLKKAERSPDKKIYRCLAITKLAGISRSYLSTRQRKSFSNYRQRHD